LKWKTKQLGGSNAAINPPLASDIVSTLKVISFTDKASIAKLGSLLWAYYSADIPLPCNQNFKVALRPSVDGLDPFAKNERSQ
jgi:hypothetical protein